MLGGNSRSAAFVCLLFVCSLRSVRAPFVPRSQPPPPPKIASPLDRYTPSQILCEFPRPIPSLLALYLRGLNEGLAVKKVILCLWLVLLMPSMALSETRDDSANFVMHGCRDALSGDTKKIAYFPAGLCVGAVMGIVYAGNVQCLAIQQGSLTEWKGGVDPPKAFTPEQAMRVVVKYIDARPERMNELFYLLAWDALIEAWPCKH
jgi:hypothetical protein